MGTFCQQKGEVPQLGAIRIWALPIVVYASEITVIFFLGNTNQSILFLDILVIVCVNLTSTSKAVIFKRLSKGLQIFTSPNRFLQ